MPVVVNPTTPVAPPVPVVSADGVLTITPRSEWAAVGAKVDFTQTLSSAVAATVWTVTLFRSNTLAVRGLDRLVAPRGVCVGWDQELTLGASQTWFARAYNRVGGVVATSGAVAVTVARPDTRAWLRVLNVPKLSAAVEIRKYPDWTDDLPTGIDYPVGGHFPTVAMGVRRAGIGQLAVMVRDKASETALIAATNVPGAFLLQPSGISTEPDVFVTLGQRQRQRPFGQSHAPHRVFTFDVTEVARPDTTGSSIPIPGLTFGEAPAVSWSSLSGRLVDYAGV